MAVQTVLLSRFLHCLGNMVTWVNNLWDLLLDKLKFCRACPEKIGFYHCFIAVCINKKKRQWNSWITGITKPFYFQVLFNCAWSMSWLTERVERATWCIWVIPWNLCLFHSDFKLDFKHNKRQRMSLCVNCFLLIVYILKLLYRYTVNKPLKSTRVDAVTMLTVLPFI